MNGEKEDFEMCPHEHFKVVRYESGVMVRKCLQCGKLELNVDYWADVQDVQRVIHEARKTEGD